MKNDKKTITLNLSNEDCNCFARFAGLSGKTVNQLLEQIIHDTRKLLLQKECFDSEEEFFNKEEKKTLLQHLLWNGHDVKLFLMTHDEIMHYKNHPEQYKKDLKEAKENDFDMLWQEQEYIEYLCGFYKIQDSENFSVVKDVAVTDSDIQLCRDWLASVIALKKSSAFYS